MKLGKMLKQARRDNKLTMDELAEKLNKKYSLNINKSMISKWETGTSSPSLNFVQAYAKEFNLDMNRLLNIEVDEEYNESIPIPVYGSIPAGTPLEAVSDIQGYVDIPTKWTRGNKEFIALKVVGDSMYPKYLDGDTVIIQLQKDSEFGQDCACYVNGYDATLKRVEKLEDGIKLIPLNPNYPPKTYKNGDVCILGIVKELRRKV